jgi:superfamily II DNA or RNA helicase
VTADTTPLRSGDIVRIRDEKWRIVRLVGHRGVALVEAAGCDVANGANLARFLLPFEAVDRLKASATPRLVSPRRWRHVARRVLADATPSWASLRAAGRADLTLIPFQLEPALAWARGDGCRFLIADAVGLGKTVQAGLMIAEVLARQPEARALVISPAALRDQWRHELHHRFQLGAEVLDAAGVSRATAHLPAGVNPWSVQPIAITSIDYIKRPEVMRSLEALTWDLVVFDEAHNLAGRSDRASAAAAIGNRARALVMLTATPHSGDDEAFGRLCNVGNLNGGHPLLVFRRTRTALGITSSRRSTLLRVRPTPAEAAMHAALMAYARLSWNQSSGADASGARLAMSVLARRACSSAESLARSLERRIRLLAYAGPGLAAQIDLPFADASFDDEEPAASLRSPGLHDAGEERDHLHHLLGLARAAARAESKLAIVRRLISRTAEPAIIFTEYRDTLQRLALALEDVDTVQLHGGLTSRERAAALRRFTEGDARLLLATDAASEGLNLHHRCRLVINLELPWSPLRLDQRAGRVDRIGQARKVHAIHLVAAGTCEESTLARLARRLNRMRDAMSVCGSLPEERRIAESALGNQPLPDIDDPGPDVQDGIVPADLRREACEEAQRLVRARGWRSSNPDANPDANSDANRDANPDASGGANGESRPVIAWLRRRGGTASRRRCFWAFRMTVTNASGQVVWESLVALEAILADSTERCRSHIRSVLNAHHPGLGLGVDAARTGTLRELRNTLGQPLNLWMRRERDLMAAMRDRYARLSAGLLQGALFDRRNERLAASQAAMLHEALSRSAFRLDELAANQDVRADSCDLAFAVVVE